MGTIDHEGGETPKPEDLRRKVTTDFVQFVVRRVMAKGSVVYPRDEHPFATEFPSINPNLVVGKALEWRDPRTSLPTRCRAIVWNEDAITYLEDYYLAIPGSTINMIGKLTVLASDDPIPPDGPDWESAYCEATVDLTSDDVSDNLDATPLDASPLVSYKLPSRRLRRYFRSLGYTIAEINEAFQYEYTDIKPTTAAKLSGFIELVKQADSDTL